MRHSRAEVSARKSSSHTSTQPVGAVTRGTTGINRLRRSDRWMEHRADIQRVLTPTDSGLATCSSTSPLAVDLGYGASHTTTVQWARTLRRLNSEVRVIGLEIDPERVLDPVDGVEFRLGGFELAGLHPQLVRAFNVLRQYPEAEATTIWEFLTSRMAPGGILVEGTCDELGRRCSWITVTDLGPQTLTMSWSPAHTDYPSQLAERLPKALIHRNVPGEKIHMLLSEADRAWRESAPLSPFGPRQRWRHTHQTLRDRGWPLESLPRRWRDCQLTISWESVAPGTIS